MSDNLSSTLYPLAWFDEDFVDADVSTAWVIAVGTATETSAAQAALWRPKDRLANVVTSADTAGALKKIKLKAAGVTPETDAAQTVTKSKLKALAGATSPSAAQAISKLKRRQLLGTTDTQVPQGIKRQRIKPVGTASEVDTARAVNFIGPKHITVDTVTESNAAVAAHLARRRFVSGASESDTAVALIKPPIKRTVGTAFESESSLAVAWIHRRLVGAVAETDSIPAIAKRLKTRAVGTAPETDTVPAIAKHLKVKAVGTAVEGNTAVGIAKTGQKVIVVSTVSEPDAALAMHLYRQRLVASVTSPSTAVSITRAKIHSVNGATEVDTARVTAYQFRRLVTGASETDQPQAIAKHLKVKSVSTAADSSVARIISLKGKIKIAVDPAVETDVALAAHWKILKTVAPASVANTANSVRATKGRALSLVTEVNTVPAIAKRIKSRTVASSVEVYTLPALTRLKRKSLSGASDLSAAVSVPRRKSKVVGYTPETDISVSITRRKSVFVSTTVEVDIAYRFFSGVWGAVVTVTESNRAGSMHLVYHQPGLTHGNEPLLVSNGEPSLTSLLEPTRVHNGEPTLTSPLEPVLS